MPLPFFLLIIVNNARHQRHLQPHQKGELSNIDESIKTIGWYLGENEAAPKGWILCRELVGYRAIENIADAIASLKCDRIDYKWYLERGFRVIGIQPNAYEKGFHLIMLGKDLSE